jgi:hypothetical protein
MSGSATGDTDYSDRPTSGPPSPSSTAYHFQIVDLRTLVVGEKDSDMPHLYVQSLQVLATRAGMTELIEHLGPSSIDVSLTFKKSAAGRGAQIVVQASRCKFKATVSVHVQLKPGSVGVVQLELSPGRSWSPIDWTVISVARSQIADKIKDRPEIVETGTRSYELDIHHLVNDVLTEGDLPVRWGASLSDIETTSEEVRLHFRPISEVVEQAVPELQES